MNKSWRDKSIGALAMCMLAGATFAQTPAGQPDAKSPEVQTQAVGQEQTLTLPASKERVQADSGSVMFVGTATVIIRYAGLTILTDPNFLHKGERADLGYGLTSERLTDPAITIDKLPPIDLIVLSHFHGDHFDQLVQEKLDRNIPIASTPDAAGKLKELGFKSVYALKTWDSLTVKKGDASLRINAMPGRHGPPVIAAALPSVMGAMLEFSAAGGKQHYRMYISGDTLVYDELKEIPRRYPDIDLALLHLGGTLILGAVKVTMDGKDGVRMLELIAPHHAIPIHYNDYGVFKSPLSDFEKEVKKAEWQNRITYLKHGQTYQFKSAPR